MVFMVYVVFDDASALNYNSLTVGSDVSVDVMVGDNSAALGTSQITAESTCPVGYTLSISGGDDNKLYLNGDSTNDYIAPSTGTKLAPTSIIGEGKLDTWGYSIESDTTSSSSSFIGLTSEMTELFTKSSASASGGDTYNIYYGASVSPSKEPGLYKMVDGNSIVYYLTTPISCQLYTIVYNGNVADSGDMAQTHEGLYEGDEVTLFASNYSLSNYGFAGWSTKQLDPDSVTFADDFADAIDDGLVFGPNETIELNDDIVADADEVTREIKLYAVWIKSAGDLQG